MKYLLQDNLGNVGQVLPLIVGESRQITVYLFEDNGLPFSLSDVPTEVLVKVFSNINQASIKKKLSTSDVALISQAGAVTSNLIGLQFTLATTDTALMAPNNNGLPMSITINGSKVTELDIAAAFSVAVPLIQT